MYSPTRRCTRTSNGSESNGNSRAPWESLTTVGVLASVPDAGLSEFGTGVSIAVLSGVPADVSSAAATGIAAVPPEPAMSTGPDAAVSGGGGAAGNPVDACCCASARLAIAQQDMTSIKARFIVYPPPAPPALADPSKPDRAPNPVRCRESLPKGCEPFRPAPRSEE